MRKLLLSVLALGLVGVTGSAFADSGTGSCPAGTKLRLIGSIQTAVTETGTHTIDTAGHDVRMIVLTCTGTACTTGLADTDTIGAAANADYKIDVGGAANTTVVVDLTATSGLAFNSGISYAADADMGSVAVYECS